MVELTPTLPGVVASYGILLANYPQGTLSIYQQSVIRGNVIREVNNAADPYSVGVVLWQCENAVTEQNVIDPAVGSAIVQYSPMVHHAAQASAILVTSHLGIRFSRLAGGAAPCDSAELQVKCEWNRVQSATRYPARLAGRV